MVSRDHRERAEPSPPMLPGDWPCSAWAQGFFSPCHASHVTTPSLGIVTWQMIRPVTVVYILDDSMCGIEKKLQSMYHANHFSRLRCYLYDFSRSSRQVNLLCAI
jgi:hypothetical protein